MFFRVTSICPPFLFEEDAEKSYDGEARTSQDVVEDMDTTIEDATGVGCIGVVDDGVGGNVLMAELARSLLLLSLPLALDIKEDEVILDKEGGPPKTEFSPITELDPNESLTNVAGVEDEDRVPSFPVTVSDESL